jgi:hypothetical protein
MQQFAVLPNQLLARGDASLGRLVLDPENPERTFHESKNLHLAAEDISVKIDLNHDGLERMASESSVKGYFTKLLTFTGHRDTSGHTQVNSHMVVTYKLLNSDDKFSDMCLGSDPATRLWIQNATKKGRKIYMISGLKCVTNAQVRAGKAESRAASAGIKVPVDAAATGGVPTGGQADVSVEAGAARSMASEQGFVAAGEQIYAVQYRQIKFRNYLRKDVDGAELENRVRWSLYLKRAANEEEEVMEVHLSTADDPATVDTRGEMILDGEKTFYASPMSNS